MAMIRLSLLLMAIVATSCTQVVIPATLISEDKSGGTPVQMTPVVAVHPTNTPELSAVMAKFRPANFPLDIRGAEWLLRAAKDGLSFRVVGIYALDRKTAFVFGSFMARSGDNARSVLFRTEDSGRNWQEVMSSFTFSEVNHVLFVQGGIGWASIVLTAEGLAGTRFWHTSDYGRSWKEIPDVNTGLGEDVLGMMFLDPLHGRRTLFDQTGNPNADGLVIEVTDDGAYTWEESLRVHTPGIMHPEEMIAAYADADGGRYGSHWGSCEWTIANGCKAFGEDGSAWNIQRIGSSRYYILRLQSIDSIGLSSLQVPMDFTYKDGNLIAP